MSIPDPYTSNIGPDSTLSALVFLVAVIEQGRYSFAARRNDLPMEVDVAIVAMAYGILAVLLTTNIGAAAALAIIMVGIQLTSRVLTRILPQSLLSGVSVVLLPYAAMAVWWLGFQPNLAEWVTSAASLLVAQFTGVPHVVDETTLSRFFLVSAAYIFIWGSGTVVTRSALGLPDAMAPFTADSTQASVAGRSILLQPAALESAATSSADPSPPEARDEVELYRWGRLIGNLERFLILTLALYGQFASIGLVLAAKSVARFDMARQRAEYFLVGTLTSMNVALVVGLILSHI